MGELTAVLRLLEATEAAGLADEPLHILADSQYAINCITKWMPGWKRKGWKKADGKPVKNRDILEAIDRAIAGRKVTFEWVKGHAGHSMNEVADDFARGVSESFQRGVEPAPGPGFGVQRPTGSQVPRKPAPQEHPAEPPSSPSTLF